MVMSAKNTVYVIAAVRTPMGSFQGALAGVPATALGSVAIRGALERGGVSPEAVQEVFMGQVLQAGAGQAPARQAALGAGIPNTVPCTTVNKVCASGMKSIALAAQSIALGENDLVVAGGMENMSQVPHYLQARQGVKLGHLEVKDGMVLDGLTDVYLKQHMGQGADLCGRLDVKPVGCSNC
jgi:acetyl-CoA C-acetyltransferase